jgi:DNA replication protein DnaC
MCVAPPTTTDLQANLKEKTMHYQNLEKLKRLRLFGMARALEDLQNLADRGQLDFADQLALLIDREATDRANTALLSRLRQARLRQSACFENLNMKAARGLDKGMIRDLFTCRWIGEHRHLIITGKTGTGKSWLACALGNQAAREGYSVLYTRLSRLLDDLAVARLGNGVGRLMRQVSKVSVLILDDWAMIDLTVAQRRDLMDVIDDRHDRGSIILTSQLPVDRWHATIGDPTYADAILDRIVHNAIRLPLKGGSLRKPDLDGGDSAGGADAVVDTAK